MPPQVGLTLRSGSHMYAPSCRRGLGAATLSTGLGSRVVVVGGADAQGNLYNDVWESRDGGTSWSLGSLHVLPAQCQS